jgi:hypothetical protein
MILRATSILKDKKKTNRWYIALLIISRNKKPLGSLIGSRTVREKAWEKHLEILFCFGSKWDTGYAHQLFDEKKKTKPKGKEKNEKRHLMGSEERIGKIK